MTQKCEINMIEAARVLRLNLPAEHDAWSEMQSAIDRGEDVGDIMNAFLDAIIAQDASHD